jgi:hypothetical protein
MFAAWPVKQEFDLYAPLHLLLHLPFGVAGFVPAAWAYTTVTVTLTVVIGFLAPRATPTLRAASWGVWSAALLMWSYVGEVNVLLGQVNPLVATGAAAALVFRRDRPRLAAVMLALAWIKPQFGLPLTVLLVAAGSARVALAGTAVAAALSAPVLGVLVAREGGVAGLLDVVARNIEYARSTGYGATTSFEATRIDVTAVLVRATGWTGLAQAEWVLLVIVLAAGAVVVRLRRDAGPPVDLVIVLVMLVCVVHQPGDLLVVPPALVATAVHVLGPGPGWVAGRRLAVAGVVVLCLPFAHQSVVDRILRPGLGDRWANTVDGLAVLAATALVVAAVVLVPARPRADAPVAATGGTGG